MLTFSLADLKALAAAARPPCVSLYLDPARGGPETRSNGIRFRGLLREAGFRLDRAGVDAAVAGRVLAPAAALVEDYDFWQQQDAGLAVFLTRGWHAIHRLPYPVEPLAATGDRFHLKPLLPLVTDDGRFLILALSRQAVRLVEATRYTCRERALPDVPTSEAEALRFDNPEKSLQSHAGAPGSRGEQTAIFHGQGAGRDEAKDRLRRYFRLVDRGLHDLLREEQAPLVLAGVDHHLPVYREANTYPRLLDEVVGGSPEHRSATELRDAAWPLVAPLFAADRRRAASAIAERLPHEGATVDVGTALLAAREGRVAECLVSLRDHCWGTLDEDGGDIRPLDRDDPLAEDLLDRAAIETVLHGGGTYPVHRRDEMPALAPVAASFRY
jgi:hypothetical protein